ncbi:MAG: class I SAM-dependent methyltransferase [Caldilineaceae bacterium]
MNCCNCNRQTVAIWREADYTVYACPACGLMQTAGPAPAGIFDAPYYENNYLPFRQLNIQHFQQMVEKAQVTLGRPLGAPLLDVGAGVGFFLQSLPPALQQTAVAIEPADYARNLLSQAQVAPTVYATIADLPTDSAPFATVTLWDVLAHTPNPAQLLKVLYERMAPDGLLLIKTPHHPRRLFQMARLLGPLHKGRAILHIPSQRFHFTPQALGQLLQDQGFGVERTLWVDEVVAPYTSALRQGKELVLKAFLRLSTRHESFLCIARKRAK